MHVRLGVHCVFLFTVVYIPLYTPIGEQLLLLARRCGGECGVRRAESDSAEGHQPWRLCAEEDGGGGGQTKAQCGLPAPDCHSG